MTRLLFSTSSRARASVACRPFCFFIALLSSCLLSSVAGNAWSVDISQLNMEREQNR